MEHAIHALSLNSSNTPSRSRASSSALPLDTRLLLSALHEMVRTNRVLASRQQHLNEVSQQLHAMNFFLNYANYQKTKSMLVDHDAMKSELECGKLLLSDLRAVVSSQENAIQGLTVEVEDLNGQVVQSEQHCAELQEQVTQQRSQLDAALQEYALQLGRQAAQLHTQEQALARMLAVRFRVDLGLDVLIALCAWYLSHHSLFSFFLRLILRRALHGNAWPLGRTERENVLRAVQVVQLAVFIAIFLRFRSFCTQHGLHQRIGSPSLYAQGLLSAIGWGWRWACGDKEECAEEEEKEKAIVPSSSSSSSTTSIISSTLSPALAYASHLAYSAADIIRARVMGRGESKEEEMVRSAAAAAGAVHPAPPSSSHSSPSTLFSSSSYAPSAPPADLATSWTNIEQQNGAVGANVHAGSIVDGNRFGAAAASGYTVYTPIITPFTTHYPQVYTDGMTSRRV